MSFERTVTEHDLDPAAIQFGEDLKREGRDEPADFTVDAFEESLGTRLLRLFRRDGS